MTAGEQSGHLLPDGLPIELCMRARFAQPQPRGSGSAEFGPCAPVVATLLTDWGWRELRGRAGRRSPSVARNTSGASSTYDIVEKDILQPSAFSFFLALNQSRWPFPFAFRFSSPAG